MKKLLSIVLSFLLVFSVLPAVSAAEQESVISQQRIELENGIVIIDTLVECKNARIMGKAARRTATIYHEDVLVGKITLAAAFNYDGTPVYVTSSSVVEKETYQGWSYVQNSLTSSGGTITLDAKMTKLLVFNIPFTISITCDANGKIS